MKQKRRSVAFTLTLLSTIFSLLLAACGSNDHLFKLNGTSKNGSSQNIPATSDRHAQAPVADKQREFVGQIPDLHAWIALVSDGINMTAFTTDGSQSQTATFAQWFKGTVIDNKVEATPTIGSQDATLTSSNSQSQLMANLSENAALGKLTLNNGNTYPFTANAVINPNSLEGLYRSERTINNVKYLAGWIVPYSLTNPSVTETPSTTATPSATDTITPSIPETVTPSVTPNTTEMVKPSVTPNTTETATPSATPSTTESVNPSGASAIINEQNGQLLQAPIPNVQDLSSKTVKVPNLDIFDLTSCHDGSC
jgi:hypothetical protein